MTCPICTLLLTPAEVTANSPGPFLHAICRSIVIADNAAKLENQKK